MNKERVAVDNNIILKYFDVKLRCPIFKLKLKSEYRVGKDVPIKKYRDNGQKIVESGLKYYTHYLGTDVGKIVFFERRKLFSLYTYVPWILDNFKDEPVDKWCSFLETKRKLNSVGLLEHYSSVDGVKTKEKLKVRTNKWKTIIGKMNSDKWKNKEYSDNRKRYLRDIGQNTKISKSLKLFNSIEENKINSLIIANQPERKKKISDAAKLMWKNARENNLPLYRRMQGASIKKISVLMELK